MTQTYPGPDGARLLVDQAPGRPVPADRRFQGRRDVAIRGAAGELTGTGDPGRLCLSWVEDGSGIRICSESAGRTLPAAELVRIAGSLPT